MSVMDVVGAETNQYLPPCRTPGTPTRPPRTDTFFLCTPLPSPLAPDSHFSVTGPVLTPTGLPVLVLVPVYVPVSVPVPVSPPFPTPFCSPRHGVLHSALPEGKYRDI